METKLGYLPGRQFRISPLDGTEQCISGASNSGRDTAAAQVGAMFEGFDFTGESQRCDTNAASLLQVAPSLLDGLDWSNALDRAFHFADPAQHRFRLAHGGHSEPVPNWPRAVRQHPQEQTGTVRTFATVDAMQDGSTAVMNDLGREAGGALARLESALGRVMGTSVQTNVYVSEREAGGFGEHWDDHDVIILQVHGRKYWEVREPGALSPVKPEVDRRAGGRVVWSGILAPGLALYIPRGWTHNVSGFEGEFSVHYTIGFTRPSAAELLQGAVTDAAGRSRPAELLRSPDRGESVLSTETFQEPTRSLTERRSRIVDQVYGQHRGSIRVRRSHGPVVVMEAIESGFDGTPLFAPFPGGAVFADVDNVASDEFVVVADASALAVKRSMAKVLARLYEFKPFSISSLIEQNSDVDADEIRRLVKSLASLDLVQVLQ